MGSRFWNSYKLHGATNVKIHTTTAIPHFRNLYLPASTPNLFHPTTSHSKKKWTYHLSCDTAGFLLSVQPRFLIISLLNFIARLFRKSTSYSLSWKSPHSPSYEVRMLIIWEQCWQLRNNSHWGRGGRGYRLPWEVVWRQTGQVWITPGHSRWVVQESVPNASVVRFWYDLW